jgi:predicted transcriptional regulator
MRTTIDLPDDLHELARQLAHEGNRSMSEVVTELIRLGLQQNRAEPTTGARGLPVVVVGRPVTAEDVRSLDDDE